MIGLVNVISIATSSPARGPSPPVFTLMPFTTVLFTVKAAFTILAEDESVPALLARVAVLISTSEGELVRTGTFPEAGAESRGKTRYSSTSTSVILDRG